MRNQPLTSKKVSFHSKLKYFCVIGKSRKILMFSISAKCLGSPVQVAQHNHYLAIDIPSCTYSIILIGIDVLISYSEIVHYY